MENNRNKLTWEKEILRGRAKGLGNRPSYTWRSLMVGRELLSEGLYRCIGDGRSTMVWKDPWIPGIKVGELTTISDEAVNYTRICDLISVDNRGWDRQVLNTIFDRDTVEKILCIPINRLHLPDRWAWKGESNGNFTVKSCYKLAMRDNWENINLTPDLFCDVPTAFWKSMWKLPVLSRFKVNFWRACLGIIPTLDALEKRGVLINEACVFCERESESVFHIFAECQAVKQVWEEARFGFSSWRYHQSLLEWMSIEWGGWENEKRCVFVIALSFIWEMRNCKKFANDPINLTGLWAKVERQWDELCVAKEGEVFEVPSSLKWEKPDGAAMKLNIDASVKISGEGALGGVIRDSEGTTHGVFMASTPVLKDVTLLEALAVQKGVEMALRLGVKELVVESNSKLVIDMLNSNCVHGSLLSSVCNTISDVCVGFSYVRFRWVPRACNQCADFICKLARQVAAWSKTNITTDESALLAFKSSITSDPYDFLANWSVSSSPCDWVGITCNARHGRVHSLNLGDMGLNGTISPHLGNLSFLVELDLSFNNFHGHLPKELVQLRRLKLLNLSFNEFDGEVPTWIGGLHALQHLSLRNNSLNGIIPLSVSNLSSLETLDWNDNFIEGKIPHEIGRLKSLKILRMANNKFSGIIPQAIFNLSSLERLSLSYNNLSGNIPKEIGDLPQLKIIYLGNNQFSGSIPLTIFNSSLLQEIDLIHNNLTGSLPSNICHGLPKLELLYLNDNNFSGELPSDWHQCKELRRLQLNGFDGGYIPSDIGNLTNLQYLYLGENNLKETNPRASPGVGTCQYHTVDPLAPGFIPKGIGNLNKLEKLDLGSNHLSGDIPFNIFNISTLTILSLSSNNLSGILPPNIGSGHTNLRKLHLSENQLTGKIPMSISNASKLVLLDLGSIPECLGNLTSLRKLYLTSNKLISHMPSSLWRLKDIMEIDLSSNALSGRIPLEISSLRALILLNLSRNQISGKIPPTIGSLQMLHNLSLAHNKLEGPIPESLENMISLEFLDLSQNFLSASALEYLHHDSSTPTIHCDVKPSNVLLDEDMVAHLSDFGMANLLGERQLQIYTETFATIGYMAPDAKLVIQKVEFMVLKELELSWSQPELIWNLWIEEKLTL
ncbi:putative LRR receptor-like serine/threonine-protein kinase [Senna tora]|uniref:Putative LRR receptor-like serine/threonine-protein kinase n=1 Tax=Senna tora TaxID=362788 RepID=A0A835CID9_9FABA|nr:putative LRR receptor-like serine/threonine-protein kinase [Senna tora]